jgi:trk system potassium uptake protein TrkA
MIEPQLHPGWLTQRVSALEEATGTRVAYVTRFGVGQLVTQSTVIQEGDRVFLLVAEGTVDTVSNVAGSAPAGLH